MSDAPADDGRYVGRSVRRIGDRRLVTGAVANSTTSPRPARPPPRLCAARRPGVVAVYPGEEAAAWPTPQAAGAELLPGRELGRRPPRGPLHAGAADGRGRPRARPRPRRGAPPQLRPRRRLPLRGGDRG